MDKESDNNSLHSLGASQGAPEALAALCKLESVVVYVGSHSHLFLALELTTGAEIWRVELGDRVESSACVSVCGHFIAVGMYTHTDVSRV